ncbi:carboxypeptidase-like regulatory domain-containing protein [Seonamhaeicola marinus]|uniref:Carboxypeptidase-like regulatory domain-containing protein n=1 Tax=Seonamhaeicola marinus TaxID=1912246 RepID=A0A5D0HI03_9FLAO|nr:carboxypeptidase-like regulatory domain-containing protein [Seonamhaeicola marinus]TYA69899.1 carboxypeptidase-like regulatory domain-containing protein [Seonamhaeicola marinus]
MKASFKVIVVLLFSLVGLQLCAQDGSNVYGKIIDSKTGKEIAFATVLMKDSKRGVIADENGGFVIPASALSTYEGLEITCIGYKTGYVNMLTLKKNEVNIIKLEVAISALDEVVVKAEKKRLSAKQIVKRAIKEIPKNYSDTAYSYVAYYRDYQKDNADYVNLNEAIVQIHDEGFGTGDRTTTKISLHDYRTNNDFKRTPELLVDYDNRSKKFIPQARIDPSGGNELTILMAHDAIRNYDFPSYSFMYIMKKHFVKHHNFNLTKITQINNENLYVIDFKLKPVISSYYLVTGQLFINRNTFAIHKLEYTLYEKKKKSKEQIFNVKVEYAEQFGHMYLNYISFNNTFKAPDPKDFSIVEATYNPYKESMSITFNHPYKDDNIHKRSNYNIFIDGQKVPVKKVLTDALNNKKLKLLLDFNGEQPPIITDDSVERVSVNISNITNEEGRVLGALSYLKYKQYRELFVQELLSENNSNTLFIDKFKSLKDGNITQSLEKDRYWMNTPLNTSN